MTPLDLMDSLQAHITEITKDLILSTRAEKNSTEKAERAPTVHKGNLPDKDARTKLVPYILLKLLTGKDEEEESTCRVRIIVNTYSEDGEENYIQCLNVITKIRNDLLETVTINERYSCQKPLEYIIYEDDTAPYQLGEIMTIWELPQVKRNVNKYLQ